MLESLFRNTDSHNTEYWFTKHWLYMTTGWIKKQFKIESHNTECWFKNTEYILLLAGSVSNSHNTECWLAEHWIHITTGRIARRLFPATPCYSHLLPTTPSYSQLLPATRSYSQVLPDSEKQFYWTGTPETQKNSNTEPGHPGSVPRFGAQVRSPGSVPRKLWVGTTLRCKLKLQRGGPAKRLE